MDTDKEFTPRPYQICLYEKAVKENAIIFLPTGTGKTFIAVLLIKFCSVDIQRPLTQGGKRTIFAVNTVSLVTQQTSFLIRHTGLVCKGFSGDMQVDLWNDVQWKKEIENAQVLVMTAQIFLNLILSSLLPLEKVNLIVFDECHRAVKDHPMRQIMQRFEFCISEERPKVLAMSATLLNSNVKPNKVESSLRELEATFQSKIFTVDSLTNVSDYSTNPEETIQLFDSFEKNDAVLKINDIIEECKNLLSHINLPDYEGRKASSIELRQKSRECKIKNVMDDVYENILEMGLYGGMWAVLLHLIQIESIKKNSNDKKLKQVLDFIITQLIKIQKIINDKMLDCGDNELEKLKKYSSPKILNLFYVLKNVHENIKTDNRFCCIIFTKRRFTAKILSNVLKKLSMFESNFNFLKADFIIGSNNDPYKNSREQLCFTKWNKEVLQNFKNGTINCIVATDVVDEGIDVPSCTLVVRYYAPQDFRAYVQSKGRARHSTSKFVILAEKGSPYIGQHQSFKQTERILQTLYGTSDIRLQPSDDDVNSSLYKTTLKPYVVYHEDGSHSCVTEQSAVSLVNAYCQNLLKSKFIKLAPIWILHKSESPDNFEKVYQVVLTLPIISNLRESITGQVMPSISEAKRSVALITCEKLHKIGELDDFLKPKNINTILEEKKYLFPLLDVSSKNLESNNIGTKSNKRRHEMIYPDCFCDACPQVNKTLYLHILKMKLKQENQIENTDDIYYMSYSNNKKFYGILSSKKMPKIPKFPLFIKGHEIEVNVINNVEIHSIDRKQLDNLKVFHNLVFKDILNLKKDFTEFNSKTLRNNFLIVPVKGDNINWKLVNDNKELAKINPEHPLKVTELEYDKSLIIPNYRTSNMYVVKKVCRNMNPETLMEDSQSFLQYYKINYGIEIKDLTQPLLEVKKVTEDFNFIKKNYSKKKKNKTQKEYFLPELSDRINFSFVYYLKALAIPSILHRVTQLLLAEKLRINIAEDIGLPLENHLEPLVIEDKFFNNNGRNNNEEIVNLNNLKIINEISGFETGIYSWRKEAEPVNLDKNLDEIDLSDIAYFHEFLRNESFEDKENLKKINDVKNNYKFAKKVETPIIKMINKTNFKGPATVDLMKALTTKMSNDEFDFERLETLGDSFLKFAICLFLFQDCPMKREGSMACLKDNLVGNRNLYFVGKNKGLPGMIKVVKFDANLNFPSPSYAVDSKIKNLIKENEVSSNFLNTLPDKTKTVDELLRNIEEYKNLCKTVGKNSPSDLDMFLEYQKVADKSVSDSIEALIAVYLLESGVKVALKFLSWLQIMPNERDINLFLNQPPMNPIIDYEHITFNVREEIDKLCPWANMIEQRLGYNFNNKAFLLQAFTHPSYSVNRITESYERLEFIGDAILDFLITAYINENCGNLSPGEITDLRSALVNNVIFACLAVRYALHTALLFHSPQLFEMINRFVEFQEQRNHQINDELIYILEEEECQMAEHVDVPKVLGDIYESVIGAIYLDCKKDLNKVWQIIYSLMGDEIVTFSKKVPKQPVRVVYEMLGESVKFVKTEVPNSYQSSMVTLSVTIKNEVKIFNGFGSTHKLAKIAASKHALQYLQKK